MINWIFQSDITERFITASPHKWVMNTQLFLEILHRDRLFYLQALKIDSVNNLRKILFNMNCQKISEYVDIYLDSRSLDEASRSFIVKFFAYAFTEMNIEYLKEGATEPPQQAALRYYDLTEPQLRIAIDNCVKRYQAMS